MKKLQIKKNSFWLGILLVNILLSVCSCNEKEEQKEINTNFQEERGKENAKHIQNLSQIAKKYEEKRKEQYKNQKAELAQCPENERSSIQKIHEQAIRDLDVLKKKEEELEEGRHRKEIQNIDEREQKEKQELAEKEARYKRL